MSDTNEPFPPATDPGILPTPPPPEPEPEPEPDPTVLAGANLRRVVESMLFAADRPLTTADLASLLAVEPAAIEVELALLAVDYQDRGVQLQAVAGGWQLRTHPSSAPWVARLLDQKPVRLARAQLETLAIIAYRQPITRPEIDDIRGVDSGGTLKTLLDRGLVRILGKKEEPGRPMLYGTTKDFLEFFNLRDLKDLPTLREFHELSQEPDAQLGLGQIDPAPPPAATPEPVAATSLVPEATTLDESALAADLDGIDALIDGATRKAQAAEKQLYAAAGIAPPEPRAKKAKEPPRDE